MNLRTSASRILVWALSATLIFNPMHPALARIAAFSDLSKQQTSPLPSSESNVPKPPYVVETNPALTELKQFMGSDYLLANLGYDPDQAQKRLGDGLYEQRLIREAVVARTGQRYLAGLSSDEAMYRYLMDNAVASKDALNLSVGVSLTAEQVAALTHDIVWLEAYEVNGEEVLVPVLYLAQAEGRLGPTGALIQGSDLALIAGDTLANRGTLRADGNLSATAGQVVNSGLMEAGDRLSVLAVDSVLNTRGGILAGRDVDVTALSGDLINERTVTEFTSQASRLSFAHSQVPAQQPVGLAEQALDYCKSTPEQRAPRFVEQTAEDVLAAMERGTTQGCRSYPLETF
ncbi:S-layer family protein [Pseudothauera nasutitermitis]|uniref:S-layer family protein n=1 Tax=Pseudothauera nasutitermitis TaxID=2565930 RepID=UPI001B3B1C51|nr:S-layer family protein [Pseudothauera nasutitermitis]